jgi:hypothetical protein
MINQFCSRPGSRITARSTYAGEGHPPGGVRGCVPVSASNPQGAAQAVPWWQAAQRPLAPESPVLALQSPHSGLGGPPS